MLLSGPVLFCPGVYCLLGSEEHKDSLKGGGEVESKRARLLSGFYCLQIPHR